MFESHHSRRMSGLALPVALLVLVSSSTAFACGESRFRLGHGIRYEAYQAPMPANVLVFESSGHANQTDGLQSAGHQVTVVSTQDQLLKALDEESYHVIIAPYSDMATVKEHFAESLNRPGLLPVVGNDADERRSAKSLYSQYLKSDASLRKTARAIHRIMEAQLR